jgi:hypothetical protein
MNDNKVNEIFGAPIIDEVETSELSELECTEYDSELDNEAYIDNALKEIVEDINGSLEKIKDLAELQESPRAWEVYSTMNKTKIDAIERLAAIQKDRIKQTGNKQIAGTITNNQINVSGVNINDILKKLE